MNNPSLIEERAIIEKIANHFTGSRWLQGYVRGKLRTDPAYRAVLDLLRQHPQSVLDIGCGLGLLSFYLRENGFREPVLGVDSDAKKIAKAGDIAAAHYKGLTFEPTDAREVSVNYSAVVMLDVLHYLNAEAQRSLLQAVAEKIPPGGIVIIRNTPRDSSWRYILTWMEEVFVRVVGWIRGAGIIHFPTVEEVADPFRQRGYGEEIRPLWGRTPFNSHLFVFTRPSADSLSE